MVTPILKTGERVIPEDFQSKEEYLVYLRHLFAYEFAKEQIPQGSTILEVGCGEGYGANLLSPKVKKIIALDVDEETIAHALKKYGLENCVFKTYDGVKIPYEDNTFDAVISFQVIEHVKNDAGFVSEIHRVLRKDGLFLVTTPNRTYRLKPGQKPLNEFHVREYYSYELENLLKSRFPDVKVWGIRGTQEVQKIETERVKPVFDPSYDPLNLRKLIPKSIRRAVADAIKHRYKSDEDFLSTYSLKDYYVIKDNIENSLGLLGLCRK